MKNKNIQAGVADLPLHHGRVPPWLANRMASLGRGIIVSIAEEYGRAEVMKRLSDPFWFQSLGCVMGMDWHSSGITTSVMGALKKAINPISHELGIHVCGGRGKHSRNTPRELLQVADKTGMDGKHLVRCSRLSAKVDNTAIQDGFQIYLHNFVVSNEGEWAVIQQGMHEKIGMARRYHWHSEQFQSFLDDPHTFIYGKNQGLILNLADREAASTRDGVLDLAREDPKRSLPEIQRVLMPRHHEVRTKDVNLKRLGAVLAIAQDRELLDFETMLLLEGMGPRTLQSLVLVSEVIHGTPSRFKDPARFSFAHGGKDGHPFPVPTKVYDETLDFLGGAISRAKLGHTDRQQAMKGLARATERAEQNFVPDQGIEALIEKERAESKQHGGRTVFDDRPKKPKNNQLNLFD